MVRTNLSLTSVALSGAYAVHELLHADTPPSVGCDEADLHPNEAVGMDILADDDQVWRSILVEGNGKSGRGWAVQGGPIEHRGMGPILATEVGTLVLTCQYPPLGTYCKNRSRGYLSIRRL